MLQNPAMAPVWGSVAHLDGGGAEATPPRLEVTGEFVSQTSPKAPHHR